MYICVFHLAGSINRITLYSLIVFGKEDEMSYYCYKNQHLSLPVGRLHYSSMGNNILSIFISHPLSSFPFSLANLSHFHPNPELC